MTMDKPLSEKIADYPAGDYHVTAAIWRTQIQHELYDTFEIGIRELKSGKFQLLQSRHFNHQSVQEVANAIAMLLGDYTQSYTPEWCITWFGRES